jgi:hypothetical protein
VHITEYAQRNEPKFSLLTELHSVLTAHQDILLGQAVPEAVALTKSCESHTYVAAAQGQGDRCLKFFSNWGESDSCAFPADTSSVLDVPAWSVSILAGRLDSAGYCVAADRDSASAYNTKTFASTQLRESKLTAKPVDSFKFLSDFQTAAEPVPAGGNGIVTVLAESPLEQLSVTNDKSDYLWYSVSYNVSSLLSEQSRSSTAAPKKAVLTTSVGTSGGGIVYAFVNGKLQTSTLENAVAFARASDPNRGSKMRATAGAAVDTNPISLTITLPSSRKDVVNIDLLSVSMGIQNYGPFLENYAVGIMSNITMHLSSESDGTATTPSSVVLGPVLHSVGLRGEQQKGLEFVAEGQDASARSCGQLCWYRSAFHTPVDLRTHKQLALDMSSMGKGSVWVNGHMLGRYWSVLAEKTATQTCDVSACSSDLYVGAYNGDRCRTGCGDYSQRYYKLPSDWLHPSERFVDILRNSVVLFYF